MTQTLERNGWSLVEQVPESVAHTVLLLPGLQGSDLVFSKLLEEPAMEQTGVRLIAGNPPGFKGLPLPTGVDCTIESYAKLVEDMARAENVDLIVGHSFAGNVLIEVAARGKYQNKLMVISPSLNRDAESKDLKTLDSMSRKPILKNVFWWLTYLMMKSVFKPYFDDAGLLALVVADAKKIPRSVGRNVLIAYFDHIDRHGNLADRLVSTEIPVTYVRGEKDDIGFSDEHRLTLEKCELVTLREIPNARHFAMVDQPAEMAEVIIEALQS